MKKNICFYGVATAVVTPFKDGEIDYVALSKIIDTQISSGIDAIIVGATTGESATLSDGEREALYHFSAEKIGGRVKFIVGTGSLDTRKAVSYTKLASRVRANGALSVTPYYNKGTEEGITEHFLAVAESSEVPTVIYNVPTRTCVNISMQSLLKLSEHENIVGLKESSDSLSRLAELSEITDRLALYSGNDYANFAFYTSGASGAVSVISNLYPAQCRQVFELCKSAKFKEALEKQIDMNPLIRTLFLETNPSVVKFAMERMGLCSSELRLPLTRPNSFVRQKLSVAMENYEKTLHG